jgi:hypothetical protein
LTGEAALDSQVKDTASKRKVRDTEQNIPNSTLTFPGRTTVFFLSQDMQLKQNKAKYL